MSRRWKIILWIGVSAGAAFAAIVAIGAITISRHARDWVAVWLTEQYKSRVDLESFHVSIVYPFVQAQGAGLVLHFHGRQDLPPLIAVNHFTLRASFWGFLGNPRRIEYVHLDGLQLNIPPREQNTSADMSGIRKAMGKFRDIRFGEIVSENATLKILTNKPGKNPLDFDIEHLDLHSPATSGEFVFRATLTNPTPPGEIVSSGTFGPWSGDAPSLTPVSGTYTFDHADLGVFPGIRGILSSKGNYNGPLEKIHVSGTTDTPDFQVTMAGHPVDLTTTFDATVDGVNGDTYLHPVVAHFRKTTLVAQGSVAGIEGRPGKTITLDVTTDQASIQDLLQFAMKEPATMTGPTRLKTKFILTPGPQQIPVRLTLDGSFALNSVHFTNSKIQQQIDNMSKRSLGKPQEVVDPLEPDTADDVKSEMKGNFRLGNGLLTVTGIEYQIPGASVQMNGTYNLGQQILDFHGVVELQARLSQTVTGRKSIFLKILDPFFSKNGKGTVLPIKITGSLDHISYGLDFGHKKETDRAGK